MIVAGRTLCAAALVFALLAGCAHEMSLPDAGVETRTDPRGELIIKGWQMEIGRLTQEGCAFHGLRLICEW
jgi:hypothetical protein